MHEVLLFPDDVQAGWTDVGMLAGVETVIIAVIFGAVWLLDVVKTASGGLVSFLHA